MSDTDKLAKMNRLFATHDRLFRTPSADMDLVRSLDSQAQAIKAELTAAGHTLNWSRDGYAEFADLPAPSAPKVDA